MHNVTDQSCYPETQLSFSMTNLQDTINHTTDQVLLNHSPGIIPVHASTWMASESFNSSWVLRLPPAAEPTGSINTLLLP